MEKKNLIWDIIKISSELIEENETSLAFAVENASAIGNARFEDEEDYVDYVRALYGSEKNSLQKIYNNSFFLAVREGTGCYRKPGSDKKSRTLVMNLPSTTCEIDENQFKILAGKEHNFFCQNYVSDTEEYDVVIKEPALELKRKEQEEKSQAPKETDEDLSAHQKLPSTTEPNRDKLMNREMKNKEKQENSEFSEEKKEPVAEIKKESSGFSMKESEDEFSMQLLGSVLSEPEPERRPVPGTEKKTAKMNISKETSIPRPANVPKEMSAPKTMNIPNTAMNIPATAKTLKGTGVLRSPNGLNVKDTPTIKELPKRKEPVLKTPERKKEERAENKKEEKNIVLIAKEQSETEESILIADTEEDDILTPIKTMEDHTEIMLNEIIMDVYSLEYQIPGQENAKKISIIVYPLLRPATIDTYMAPVLVFARCGQEVVLAASEESIRPAVPFCISGESFVVRGSWYDNRFQTLLYTQNTKGTEIKKMLKSFRPETIRNIGHNIKKADPDTLVHILPLSSRNGSGPNLPCILCTENMKNHEYKPVIAEKCGYRIMLKDRELEFSVKWSDRRLVTEIHSRD